MGALSQVARDVGADGGASLYLDDGDGVLQLVASTVAQAADSREPLGRDLLSRLRRGQRETRGSMLVLSVPDSSGGVLILERTSFAEFNHHDRALAMLGARSIADNVTLNLAQLRGGIWTRQLEAVQRIASRLTRLSTIDEVAAAVCSETRRVIDYDEAHLLVRRGDDEPLPAAVVGAPAGVDGRPVALNSQGNAAQAVRATMDSGRPMLLERTALGPEREGSWSLLIVPISYERATFGAICLLRRGPGRFDDSQQQLLQIIADQTAVAMENTRLLAGRDELLAELRVLLEISHAAAVASSERQLGDQLAALMRGALAMDACVISRRDEGSTVLRTLGRAGIDGPDLVADSLDRPTRRAVLTDGLPRVVQAEEGSDTPDEVASLRLLGASTSVLLPLHAGGPPLGLVELISFAPRWLSRGEMELMRTMSNLATAGLERTRLLEQLRLAADIDPLTGVNSPRYLRSRLRQEVARAARSRNPLSVLMLDLDEFKPVNDRYGHAEGDRLLTRIANTIRAHVRTVDIVARYGGDEFVVIMPDTSAERARVVARRIVKGVRDERHPLSDGSEAHVGVSAGLAVFPDHGRTAAALLSAADGAMYAAKRGGRARVGLAELGPENDPAVSAAG